MNIVFFKIDSFDNNLFFAAKTLNAHNDKKFFCAWDNESIKTFFNENKNALWVGHGNNDYDNVILSAVLRNENVFERIKFLKQNKVKIKSRIDFLSYDLKCMRNYTLSTAALVYGFDKNSIEITETDKKLDLDFRMEIGKVFKNILNLLHKIFIELQDEIILRLTLINKFNIPKNFLTATEAQLSALALGSKKISNIENEKIKPILYENLQVENQNIIDFYLNECFRNGETYVFNLCGLKQTLGSGGLHSAEKKYSGENLLYIDVKGYYSLIMINYDLLPRTIPSKSRENYKKMYYEQLQLKKTNPTMRNVYKKILLTPFGASLNKNTDFYDSQTGSLVAMTGQLFLIDLLEKLEGKIKLVQSNTDGIIIKPLEGYSESDIKFIVDEWCYRTNFDVEIKKIKKIFQRDVNCYFYITENIDVECRGDVFKSYNKMSAPIKNNLFSAREPAIISVAVINYLKNGVLVEDTVEGYKNEFLYFQYICDKGSFDFCEKTVINLISGEETTEKICDENRCFAAKENDESRTIIKKVKINANGKINKSKMPSMPENYIIYNKNILDICDDLQKEIDYDFYIYRAYQHIYDFLNAEEF